MSVRQKYQWRQDVGLKHRISENNHSCPCFGKKRKSVQVLSKHINAKHKKIKLKRTRTIGDNVNASHPSIPPPPSASIPPPYQTTHHPDKRQNGVRGLDIINDQSNRGTRTMRDV